MTLGVLSFFSSAATSFVELDQVALQRAACLLLAKLRGFRDP